MSKFLFFLIFFLVNSLILFAQEEDEFDIFLIDAYITPETPHTLIITFMTSDSAKTKVILNNKYVLNVSDNFKIDHKLRKEVSEMDFDSMNVPFKIIATDINGKKHTSEEYELTVPNNLEIKMKKGSNAFAQLCIGGSLFLLPSPSAVFLKDRNYFELTKEIPIFAFYSTGFNYPSEYLSVEYSHIFNAPIKNFLRIGYKKIFLIPKIEFVAVGINVYTDFLGHNGFSPELNFGLFKIFNVFTVFTKYRFNFQLFSSDFNFHEISIGLYSSFFSINL